MIDPNKLEELFKPSNFSLEMEREQSVEVSEYNIKYKESNNVDLSETLDIHLDNSLLINKENRLEKITPDKFFDLLNSEQVLISPEIKFPKIKKIDVLYALLSTLAEKNTNNYPIIFTQKSNNYDDLIQSLVFFKFLEQHYVDNKKVYLVTEYFSNFVEEKQSRRYMYFVKILGANNTVRKALSVQINNPIYDRISKKMITNYLLEDLNIIEEKLKIEELENIVNNFRYWYLDIRSNLLI